MVPGERCVVMAVRGGPVLPRAHWGRPGRNEQSSIAHRLFRGLKGPRFQGKGGGSGEFFDDSAEHPAQPLEARMPGEVVLRVPEGPRDVLDVYRVAADRGLVAESAERL